MTFEERLLSGILVAIVAWLVTNVVMYVLRRERIASGLITDIGFHIGNINESIAYLQKWLLESVKIDNEIGYSTCHTPDD
jgi:hypothetical protein